MKPRWGAAGAAVAGLLLAACGAGSRPAATQPPSPLPAPVAALLAEAAAGQWRSSGDDPWQVWICHVPQATTASIYADQSLRLPLTAQGVTDIVNRSVAPYFATLAHGQYRIHFAAGGDVTMRAGDDPQACLDSAFAMAPAGVRGVLAVADAEHAADQPGGFGTAGKDCARPPCPVGQSRRGAYVGAADFHPDWGQRPPMDLIEHEIGHALGWPHSGYDPTDPRTYSSGIDLMSNSAAPRDTDPDRRDGPDTLAVNRLAAGWLPVDAIAVVPASGARVHLQPSTGGTGIRVAVIGLDSTRFVTVEVLPASGFDAHLPASGVAVHLIVAQDTRNDGDDRAQTPLVGAAPFTALLRPGDSIDTNGWHIAVFGVWQVDITPSAGH